MRACLAAERRQDIFRTTKLFEATTTILRTPRQHYEVPSRPASIYSRDYRQ
jgi:hypothetical protein